MSTWPHPRSRDGGVDEIPLPGVEGRLWLCGKHVIGPDPQAVLDALGATTVVCLVQDHELHDRYPDYLEWLRANTGVSAVWVPVPDLHAPTIEQIRLLVDELRTRLIAGERIVMHCAAGIGRTGTVATCLLMSFGVDREEALRQVAAHRPMAGPEVGAQRDLVASFDRA